MTSEIVPVEAEHKPVLTAYTEDIRMALSAVRTLQAEVLRPDVDYGTIPGTGNKPTLLKSGAESLLLAFRLSTGNPDVRYIQLPGIGPAHFEVRVSIPIIHRESGTLIGYGIGSCSTAEKKYRWRRGERKCPNCGKPAIIKGRAEYGGGWLCYGKKGGCGSKFGDHDPAITGQEVGQVENPDIADTYNTVLKMAKKRALVDGALTCCAASGVFTQDVEDMPEYERYEDPVQQPEPAQTAPAPEPQPEPQSKIGAVERESETLEFTITKVEGKPENNKTLAFTEDSVLFIEGETPLRAGERITATVDSIGEQRGWRRYTVRHWQYAMDCPPIIPAGGDNA